MFLIVGLGNPGAEYAKTRHNVGFMVADAVHDKYGFAPYKVKFDGLISEGKIDGEKVYLLKPQTYMNLSGNSVVKAAAFYKILPQNIVVIHDDMDLKITQIKAKLGGGAGGHNGLKSIDAAVLEHNILLVTENIGLLLKDGVAAFSNRIGNLNKSALK